MQRRNPIETKERLLKAGMSEFCIHGYKGARIVSICKKAKCNIRMLYHYYDGKKNLYLACLDRVYMHIRFEESRLNLHLLEPQEALEKLMLFTFNHMEKNLDFIAIVGVENNHKGKYIKQLPTISNAANELIITIEKILNRGVEEKLFRDHIDAFQLYLSILSMSYLHLSNRYTLSFTYERDISDKVWREERYRHIIDMVLTYVKAPPD
jgi:AcrR family transcriptional regulator